MNYIEKTGKTIEDAINIGLLELKCEKEDVDIEIIEKGSKGFFGIGLKKPKVRLKYKFNPEKISIEFLQEIAKHMNINIKIDTILDNNNLKINIYGDNIGILIGKRAKVLDSLQHLLTLVINKGKFPYINVSLDSQDYRKKREETLQKLAINLSKKVKKTGKKVILEPMPNYERKIIHTILQKDEEINTYSQGKSPNRYIVISLKNNDKFKMIRKNNFEQ